MSEELPYTECSVIEECSKNNCHNIARYFIQCHNNYTGSIYAGHCCDICLPKAIKNDFKIVGYLTYPNRIEITLPKRKTNADFGNPTGIFDMKSIYDEIVAGS